MFLTATIAESPAYSAMVEKVKEGGTFLEVGSLLGTDLRQLVFDGAPSDCMYTVDIANFSDVGFEMFQDRRKFNTKFTECDILSPTSELLELQWSIDTIYICYFLHQWNWETQVKALKQLVALSRLGTMVVGF
jgi:hypothetical protein